MRNIPPLSLWALLLFVIIVFPYLGHASNQACLDVLSECQEKKEWYNLECVEGEPFRRFDKKLNNVYRDLIEFQKKLPFNADQEVYLLRSAQRSWIKLRDGDCHFEAGVHPGAGWGWGFRMAVCKFRKTCERIIYLEKRLRE